MPRTRPAYPPEFRRRPSSLVRTSGRPIAQIADELGVSPQSLRTLDFRAFAALKRRWGVSLAALLYRARELGRLTDNSPRWAVTTLSRQYGRRTEPVSLGPVGQPKLLARAAELAFGANYRYALAAELHLSL